MWQAKRPCLLCRLLSFPTSNCGSRSTLLLFPEWRHSLMKLLSYYAPYETGCAVTLETIPALNTFKRCFTTCHLPFVASLHFSTLGIICLSLFFYCQSICQQCLEEGILYQNQTFLNKSRMNKINQTLFCLSSQVKSVSKTDAIIVIFSHNPLSYCLLCFAYSIYESIR